MGNRQALPAKAISASFSHLRNGKAIPCLPGGHLASCCRVIGAILVPFPTADSLLQPFPVRTVWSPFLSEKEAQRAPGSLEEAFRTDFDFDGRKQKMNQGERVAANFGSTRPCFALTSLVWCHCLVSCETCVLIAHLTSPFPSPASMSPLASQGTMLGVLKGPACSNTPSVTCWGGDMMGFVKNIQLVIPTLPSWLIGIRYWKP